MQHFLWTVAANTRIQKYISHDENILFLDILGASYNIQTSSVPRMNFLCQVFRLALVWKWCSCPASSVTHDICVSPVQRLSTKSKTTLRHAFGGSTPVFHSRKQGLKGDSVCAHSSHTLKPQVYWQLNWKCIRQLFVGQFQSCNIQSFWSSGELCMWNDQARLSFQRGPKRNAAVHLQRLRPAFILVTALTVLHALTATERRPTRCG